MRQRWFGVFSFLVFTSCLSPGALFAEIRVDSAATQGMFVVTSPSGEVTVIEEGEAIPPLVSGSQLEVFDGVASVSVDEGEETFTLTCLENKISLAGGQAAEVACSEASGKARAVKGHLAVTLREGKEVTLNEGGEYYFGAGAVPSAAEVSAPETEAGDVGGVPSGQPSDFANVPPVDSRSIEASPGA